jgi:tRNA nucleotidyltransferase (CCA-adding enzyme)
MISLPCLLEERTVLGCHLSGTLYSTPMQKKDSFRLPAEVQHTIATLQDAGFEAFAVGGCVRDLLLGRAPKDWDVTTSASPKEMQRLFPKSFYTNVFGTVIVLTNAQQRSLKEIEVTTYRTDAGYSDKRHPDAIHFTKNLREDLARRDFTINAMAAAVPPDSGGRISGSADDEVMINGLLIIDPFGGLKDLDARLLRAVGNPTERFSEDALRLLRAVRLATQLDYTVEAKTLAAVVANARNITRVSQERVRDEVVALASSAQPEKGFNLLQQTGLLKSILPELEEGVGVAQNKHHRYTVFEHSVKSLQFAAHYHYPLHVRLAALWHDIGKPRTRRPQGNDYTFHGHDIVGARMTEMLMRRLRFPNKLTRRVAHLVRYHMFYYDVGKVTEAGARRLLRRIGPENFDDAIKVRIAERKGSGVPKAEPYRLRHLQFLVEKAAQEPITTAQLAIGGNDLIQELKLAPGPQIGGILSALLAAVLDDPAKNTREWLLARAAELKNKDPSELKKMGELAKEAEAHKREDDIKRKYHV